MTDYRRKPTPVKAWQFEIGAARPDWLTAFRAQTPLGPIPVSDGLGTLLVPTKSGATLTAEPGEWLVLDETFSPLALIVVKPDAFQVAFEPAEAVDQVQVGAIDEKVADASPAPTAEPAPTPAKATRGKAAQAAEAAPEAPAAETGDATE